MTFFIFRMIRLRGLKPSSVHLKFVDHSLVVLKGCMEDVLINIDQSSFLVDFNILDDVKEQDGELIS